MIDWAVSGFTTSVVTVFLGPYLTNVARAAANENGIITPFGIGIHPGSWFSFVVSMSVLVQVLALPVVGAIADRSHIKKLVFVVMSIVGSVATTLLYFLNIDDGNYLYGGFFFIAANAAFGACMVVTNAYLNELATIDERDKVSSRGWAVGYLGGGMLLLIHLLWYESVKDGGGDTSLAVRMILASTGIWWILFALIPMSLLPRAGKLAVKNITIRATFRQLHTTLRHMATYKVTLLFFISYLLYNDAVQTVIVMASAYGQEELGLGLDVLTKAILMVQFVAIGGSLLFERVASWIGSKNAIIIALLGWIGVVITAYAAVTTESQFYLLAFVIALVLGGTQALSRSLFSQLIPSDRAAEYFSLYEISDRGTSWIGPLLFGIALTMSGSYRTAILSLVLFLVIGLALLLRVDVTKGIRDSGVTNHE